MKKTDLLLSLGFKKKFEKTLAQFETCVDKKTFMLFKNNMDVAKLKKYQNTTLPFVRVAFTWEATKEGFQFWYDVDKKTSHIMW